MLGSKLGFLLIVTPQILAQILSSGSDYTWNDAVGKRLPCGSPVTAGWTEGGLEIFVGRAWHKENLLPAQVIPDLDGAHVGLDGVEHIKSKYMVLCDGDATWKSSRDGRVPKHAIPFGHTADGEDLFYGRVQSGDAILPGKISRSIRGILVPLNGKEVFYAEYEVLIMQ